MNLNDLTLRDTLKGGDFVLSNDFELTVGIDNNVYLCLFGGNPDSNPDAIPADGDERLDYWGNRFFKENDKKFESRLERALLSTALNSQGRASIEAAARADLRPLEKIGTVEVSATVPRLNVLELSVTVTEKTTGIAEEFLYIWDAEREALAREQSAAVTTAETPRVWVDGKGNIFTDSVGNDFTY